MLNNNNILLGNSKGFGFVVGLGDSNMDGRGSTKTTVPTGILYNWNGSSFDNITTQTVAIAGDFGSVYQSLAIARNSLLNQRTYIYNGGVGGSNFYPDGDDNNWYTSGDNYAIWLSEVQAAATTLGVSMPDYIVVNLGVNDVRAGTSIANITDGVQSLLDRLEADLPGVPILLMQIGQTEALTVSQLMYQTRNLLVNECAARSNCHIVGSAIMYRNISGSYNVDNLHYATAMLYNWGFQIARWETYKQYEKWSRSIICSHYDDIPTVLKDAIQTWRIAIGDDYFRLSNFSLFKTSHINNFGLDFTLTSFNVNNGATLTSNILTTDGTTSQYLIFGYINSYYDRGGAGQTDNRFGIRLGSITTAAGTLSVVAGCVIPVNQRLHFSNPTGAALAAFADNTSVLTNSTEQDYAPDSQYEIFRNGTTQGLIKNKVVDASAVSAATGTVNISPFIGARNNNATPDLPFASQYLYAYSGPFSGWTDYDAFVDASEALKNWL